MQNLMISKALSTEVKPRFVLGHLLFVLLPLFAMAQSEQMNVKKKLPIIHTGKLACSEAGKETVWSAVSNSGAARKCTVTVNYQGSEGCKAWFGQTGSSSGTPPAGATWKRGEKIDVTSLDFHCEGRGGQCSYAIRQIDCGPGQADQKPHIGHLAHRYPKCFESAMLFEPPIVGQKCNVTVRYHGTEACNAALWEEPGGSNISGTDTHEKPKVVTVQNAGTLNGRCSGMHNVSCDFEVLETECP